MRTSDRPSEIADALRVELDAISVESRKTLRTRAAIATVGTVFLAFPLGPATAVIWLLALILLDAALHGLAVWTPRTGQGQNVGIGLYVVVLFMIGLTWSAVPVAFAATHRLALQMAGVAVLVSQLMDLLTYTFKLRLSPWILGAAPLCLFVVLPIDAALSDRAAMSDLAVLAFCLVGTTTYLLAAMRQNRVAAERLEASNEAAEAASRAKSSFVSTISHELRTPMNAVIGLAHALKTASSPVERDERLDLIIRSGEGLMLLLNDVLDLSKVEAGKLSIEARAFDIKDLAQEVADLWSPLASAKGLAFAATYEPDASAWVLGDSGRLRQVVGNLISNAIKFTPAGHVAVRFAHAPARDGCVDLSIEVEDSGIGISAAEESGLFQPFSQANASTSRRYGGTGLGLSISRALVELMGGVLVLRRPSPDGAAFVVRLTLPSSPPAPGRPDAPETAGSLAGARILVVDDNSVNLRVAAILLTALEAKAETASSGAEALQALARADFDLVLLDIHMPDMDGREVLQRIRGGEAGRRGIAVVACTADAMTDQVANLVAAGFDAVQPKPIVPTQLAATINVALAASARR